MSAIKQKRPKNNRGDYEIGRGKPPKHTRFKPGQSGNPSGRRKGSRNFKSVLKSTLRSQVKLTRDGKPHKVSTQEAMLLRLREKALNGDSRSLDRLILLAQTYDDDEVTTAASLSANDAHVLDIYRSRVLSGVAALPGTNEAEMNSTAGDHSAKLSSSRNGHQQKKIRRLPLLRRTRSDD